MLNSYYITSCYIFPCPPSKQITTI